MPAVLLKFFNCFVPIKEQEVEPVLYSFSALFTVSASLHRASHTGTAGGQHVDTLGSS